MIGSILVKNRWTQAICAAACACAMTGPAFALDTIPPLLSRAPVAPVRVPGGIDVAVTLYRDVLTAGDKAIYNEIFGHFADAIFEATEGQNFVNKITVLQNGQPVVDTPPTITIAGDNPATVDAFNAYFDAGATAFDLPDGDITSSIITVNNVNTSVSGIYRVFYIVSDSSGQQTVAFRVVNVRGKNPVITLLGQNPLNMIVGGVYPYIVQPISEPYALANDVTDGNLLPPQLTIDGSTLDTQTAGSYFITYSAIDSDGNKTTAVRKVNVLPAPPTFPIIVEAPDPTGPPQNSGNPMTIPVGAVFNDPGIAVFDDMPGVARITTYPPLLQNGQQALVAGNYEVTYLAIDSDGNRTTEIRSVIVVGKAPVIRLLGDNPLTVEVGTAYQDAGATASDVSDGNLTGSILTADNVNTSQPGTYRVQYQVTDSQGNTVNEFRTVNVIKSFDLGQPADIYWQAAGVPSFPLAGGIGTVGGSIQMYDVFKGGNAGADLNFLATPLDRRRAGYALAALWMQYRLGLGGEFKDRAGDIAVKNSLLADPFTPALDSTGLGLNFSATETGVPTGGAFDVLEDTRATPQFRLQGASAWATISRTYDPKPARLVAKRPRTSFPELALAAPVGANPPQVNLVSLPTGPFLNTKYFPGERFRFRIATENSMQVVSGKRTRAAATCEPGRLIDIPTAAPIVFEFPADEGLDEIKVLITEPCTANLIDLDSRLTDPLGRVVNPETVTNPTVQRLYDSKPSITGTWRLELSARAFTAEGVQVDVIGSSFADKHRVSVNLVNEPSDQATTTIEYPNPIVLQVSDTAGRAIRGATVKGNLRLPTGIEVPLNFTDNGVSPDLIANDGYYSVEYRYSQYGEHNLEVTVTDPSGATSFTNNGTSRSPSLDGTGAAVSTPAPPDEPVGEPFTRTIFLTFTIHRDSVQFPTNDDYGNTAAEFTSLLLTNADKPGRIDTPTDVDFFRIQVRGAGPVDTVARITKQSGTAAFLLRMFDSTGAKEIARGAAGPSGYPQIRRDLDPGTYFLSVSASGAMIGDTYSVSAGPPIPSDLAAIGIDTVSGGSRGGGGGGGGGCFIATAAYGTPLQMQIGVLRDVRDSRLLTNPFGAAFTDTYYRLSPPIADTVARSVPLRGVVRFGIEAALAVLTWDPRAMFALGVLALLAGFASAKRLRKSRA